VESELGRGSVFSLVLPINYAGDETAGAPTPTAAEVTQAEVSHA